MKHWHRLIVVIILQLFPALVWGNELHVIPSISVQEQYNSNISMVADNIKRDFITTLSPGLEIVNNTERLDTDLQVRFDRLEYSKDTNLNATNEFYNGKLRYKVTPLIGISVQTGYMKNSNPTLDSGPGIHLAPGTIIIIPPPGEPGQPGLPGSGQGGGGGFPLARPEIPLVAIPWHRISASLSADCQLTEKALAMANYNFGRDYYMNPKYLDDFSHDVNVGLLYDLARYFPRVKGRANVGYSFYHFPDSRNSSVRGTVGFSRDLNEVWSVLVDIGLRRTWSEIFSTALVPIGSNSFLVVRDRHTNEGWGLVGGGSLAYKGEYLNANFTYTKDLSLASAFGGAAEHNVLALSTLYRLTNELSAVFEVGYNTFKSSSSSSAHIIDQQTFFVKPGVRYEFSRDVTAQASYGYTRMNCPASSTGATLECATSNIKADRHVASVILQWQHSFLE